MNAPADFASPCAGSARNSIMARNDIADESARLILIYNANGGVLNALKDAVHKIAKPATYPCSLCALTYGWAVMHSDWRRFVFRLPVGKMFLYRNQMEKVFPGLRVDLPAILFDHGYGEPDVLVSSAELNALQHRRQLMALLADRLGEADRAGN